MVQDEQGDDAVQRSRTTPRDEPAPPPDIDAAPAATPLRLQRRQSRLTEPSTDAVDRAASRSDCTSCAGAAHNRPATPGPQEVPAAQREDHADGAPALLHRRVHPPPRIRQRPPRGAPTQSAESHLADPRRAARGGRAGGLHPAHPHGPLPRRARPLAPLPHQHVGAGHQPHAAGRPGARAPRPATSCSPTPTSRAAPPPSGWPPRASARPWCSTSSSGCRC